jgi:hypothetical protein
MTARKLGIWMDHQHAHFTEFISDPMQTNTIDSKFTHEAKELSLHQGENKMHTKENHQQAEFYKELGKIIKQYDDVILFGPTSAKAELFNIVSKDHLFSKIKIEVKETDKMTEKQQHAFVKNHFSGEVSI